MKNCYLVLIGWDFGNKTALGSNAPLPIIQQTTVELAVKESKIKMSYNFLNILYQYLVLRSSTHTENTCEWLNTELPLLLLKPLMPQTPCSFFSQCSYSATA